MASLRDIFVRLGIKTDPKGLRQADRGIEKVKESALSLGRVLTTGVVAIGFHKMITLASDIAETSNKFDAVFTDAAGSVQASLDDIRKRTGATNLELQQMSSSIGALIRPSLGSAKAAGDMASRVSELALDIASFNNVTSEEAVIALRAGLIGSQEPLQRFGVDVRVAALEMEALRMGIRKSVKDMSEGEKMTVRFSAIQRQLGSQGALGDATKTADGFANASRNMVAAIKEAAGIMGTFFLGAVGKMVLRIRSVIESFREWMETNRELIQQRFDKFVDRVGRVVGAVVDLTTEAATAARDWFDDLGSVGQRIVKITGIVLGLLAVMMLPGAAILILIALIGLLIEDFQTWRKGGESVIGDLIWAFQELGGIISDWAQDALADIAGAWNGILSAVTGAIDGMVQAVMGFGQAIAQVIADIGLWLDEYRTTISVVTSMAAAAASLYVAHWIRAHRVMIRWMINWHAIGVRQFIAMSVASAKSALASSIAWIKAAPRALAAWAVTSAWMVRLWIHQATQAVALAARSAAAWIASATRTAAAWLLSTAPLVLTAALLTIIIGTLIFLGRELVRLALGQENFFSTMADGFAGLREEYGGIIPAIKEMLAEAARYWVDFFGGTREQVDQFIEDASATLADFWSNVIDGWKQALLGFVGWVADKIPDFGIFGRNENEGSQAAGATTGPLATMPSVMAPGAITGRPQVGGTTNVTQNRTDNIRVSVQAGPGMDERRLAEMIPQEIRRARESELRQEAQSFALEGAT